MKSSETIYIYGYVYTFNQEIKQTIHVNLRFASVCDAMGAKCKKHMDFVLCSAVCKGNCV